MSGIFPLRGVVKNYEWGGYSFIPQLYGINNSGHKPFAEYWMGIHPQGSSEIMADGKWEPLAEEIGSLPFLFKVLDVRDMLSIQVHPDKTGAELGYDRENALGIPLDAGFRNYRDRNHKPELMVALDDFWLLHGFKPVEEMTDILTNVPALNELLPVFREKGYEGLYRMVMEMPQDEVNRLLAPLREELSQSDTTNKYSEDHWAARAFQLYTQDGNIDRGVFSIYLFNLLHLKKGEGIFQGAGLPHAYLEGQNVEIMANSDNVLRGGLTNKHIDVSELMKHVKCEATYPAILSPEPGDKEFVYRAPVADFSLKMIRIEKGEKVSISSSDTAILLPTEGKARVIGIGISLELRSGQPLLFKEDIEVTIAAEQETLLFMAS